jgi:ABC-type branched-subunit amino acid transport system ATPase component
MNLLQIKDLDAWYGNVQILHKVSIGIGKGEIVSIIGPNGAGKSTLLKAVFGLVGKRKGKIAFLGKEISKVSTSNIVRKGICYVPQGRSVFPSLTVNENLEMGAFIRKNGVKERLNEVYDKFPLLKQRKSQKAGLLSGGEQQMLALGRALMLKPKLLLLDEPSLGLSPKIKKVIFDKIREINSEGISILIVEQNARMSLSMSSRAYVLETGKNKLQGTGKGLLNDKRVQKLYLGGEF